MNYTNTMDVAGYAQDAMRWAVDNGTISGTSAVMFPQRPGPKLVQIRRNQVEALPDMD